MALSHCLWSLARAFVLVSCFVGSVFAQGEAQDAPAVVSQSADDAKVEQTLRSVFGEVVAFQGLRVTVRSGVVKLSGTAPTSSARDRAEAIAAAQPNVLYVDNGIELPAPADPSDTDDVEVSPSAVDERLAENLRNIFGRFEQLESVRIEVAAGVVKLQGEVVEVGSREIAEQLAKSIDGVVFVSNQIEESKDVTERLLPSVEKIVSWAQDFAATLPLFVVALLVALLFWWFGRVIANSDRLFARLSDKSLVQNILRQVVKSLFLLVGLFLALEFVGATALVGAVLGTAGVVGLAIGFAFRDIVENYLASIILSVRQPFRSKDLVEIDGHRGTVIHMTTRDTVLMTAEGNHLTLPNAYVFKSTIVNFTRAPRRRFDVAVGVGTDVDLKRATELGLGVLQKMKGVVGDPAPYARVENLGDSSVTVRFYGWVDQRIADFSKVESVAVRLIKAVMDDNQIDMPVPTYQITLQRSGPAEPESIPSASKLSAAHADAASADVAPDDHIEKQVDEELRRSDEADLLASESTDEDEVELEGRAS